MESGSAEIAGENFCRHMADINEQGFNMMQRPCCYLYSHIPVLTNALTN